MHVKCKYVVTVVCNILQELNFISTTKQSRVHDLATIRPFDKLRNLPLYSKDYIYSTKLDIKEPSSFHVVVQHVG
jgi:hypothetical protein